MVGLQPPPAVKNATALYLAEQDVVDGFLAECCMLDDSEAMAGAGDLFDRFSAWRQESGREQPTQKEFSLRLQSRLAHKRRAAGCSTKASSCARCRSFLDR
jgi:phage/plasmid-associated DNA primase